MIDYTPLYNTLLDAKADAWVSVLPKQLAEAFDVTKHGTLSEWQTVIESTPSFTVSQRLLNNSAIQLDSFDDLTGSELAQFNSQLKSLNPWRKGPYDLMGVTIDTEWRSDWKWDRLKSHIAPLEHRLVLDVGCGNGYHCWRMLGAGAKMVVGIDPMLLNVMQFHLIRKLHGEAPIYVLPLGIEDMPYGLKVFDTVFSMGVLYHRRSPMDHLYELRDSLRSGGELVLETLVIDGGLNEVLVPEDRYAMMRNVWFLPTCDTLISWLARCGFKNIRLIDVTTTTIEEQRSTDWMQFQSLKDFLNPDDSSLTYEGLPAPKRAIIIANAP